MKAIFTTLACLALLQVSTPALAQVDIDKSGWTAIFEDDFNDPSTIDPSSSSQKWLSGYYFGQPEHALSNNLAYYSTDNVRIHDGVIDFTTQNVANNPVLYKGTYYNYKSGAITSKFNDAAYSGCYPNPSNPAILDNGFLYGMFEVKCKMPKGGANRLGAFWMDGHAEVDVFEFDGKEQNKFASTVQSIGYPPADNPCRTEHTKVSPFDLTEGYHVYTLVWTPTAVSFFFDGREVRTDLDPRHIPVGCDWRRMQISLDAEVWVDLSNIYDEPFSVDYVRVYKPANGNYATTPYKRTTAINSIDCLNWNTTTIDKAQTACYSRYTVPTKDFCVTSSNDVFYKNDNGNMLKLSWNNNTSQWDYQNLNPNVNNVTANVASTANGSNVYYSDASGRMFNFWNSPNWQSDCLNWNVSDVSNNIVVSAGTSNIYYRNKNNGLSNFWYSNGWQNNAIWEAQDISPCEGSVAVSGNYIFFKTTNGQLKYIAWTGSGFTSTYSIPGASNVQSSIVIKVNNPNQGVDGLQVFYIGNDGTLYNSYTDASAGGWVTYGIWEANNASAYLCLSDQQLYYKGNDGKLWNAYWYDGWRVAPVGYYTCPEIRGGLSVGNDGRIFFANRYLYNAWPAASKLEAVPCSNQDVISNARGTASTNSKTDRIHDAAYSDLSQLPSGNYNVTVYDKYGKIVKSAQLADINSDPARPLNLPPGFYILHFANRAGEVVNIRKVIVAE